MAIKTVRALTGGTNSHSESAFSWNALATDILGSGGVVGAIASTSGIAPCTGAYAVNAQSTPNMSVRVTNGVLWMTGTPTGGVSQAVRVDMDAFEDVTIPSNSSGSTKYDWVYMQLDAAKMANPAADASDVATLFISRSTSNTVDNGTPPTYGLCLAVITVANGAATITNANITDSRVQAGVNTVQADKIRATSGQHLQLVPGANKLVKTTVLRQDNTTNVYQSGNSVVLTGWGVIVTGAAPAAAETVTFGVTFAQAPIVVASFGGDNASSTTYGSGGSSIKLAIGNPTAITTSSFLAQIRSVDGTNWAAGNTVFYQWIAIGELA